MPGADWAGVRHDLLYIYIYYITYEAPRSRRYILLKVLLIARIGRLLRIRDFFFGYANRDIFVYFNTIILVFICGQDGPALVVR